MQEFFFPSLCVYKGDLKCFAAKAENKQVEIGSPLSYPDQVFIPPKPTQSYFDTVHE